MKIGRRLQALILGISLAIAALVGNTPIGGLVERAFDPLRAAATRHAASGRVVVVEMDAASIAAIHRWPWSRAEHARVVDRLRRAGAASIVFDVDMSSNSSAEGDAAMAAALARANGLVALPTFAQNARAGDTSQIDALPIAAFRDHVALASVSIAPDSDGAIRRAPFGTMTRDTPRPSLSAYIAHRSGAADTFFPIDFGIDPVTIPRLSFVAVRDGRFDPHIVRGRDIVIGATAVEMGDRYAVPHWGVIPGVTIQAIAAETLIQGVPAFGSVATVLAICLMLGFVVIRQRRAWSIAAAGIVTVILFFGMVMAAQRALHIVYPLTPGLTLLALAAAGRFAALVASRFEQQRLVDESTGMPNRRAMLRVTDDMIVGHVAVAHIVNLDTLLAVIGEAGSRDLVMRIADRLRLAARGAAIYRLSDRSLGFVIDPLADLDDAMAGLRAVMLQPVEIQARRVDVAIAIGVADDGAGSSLDERLNAAALAADAAERSGAFWQSGSADVAALERQVSLMGELDDALAKGQIEVFYQPKLRLADDRIASVEALVRWRHPVRGFVPPDTFIPLAEQTDRIEPLTLFVMARVLDDLCRWRALGLGLTAAINISATLITKPSFDAALRAALATSPVPPSDLILEVTESATLADPAAAARMLGGYRDMGLAISMDDYGTGQSTLTYLRQLPLSELKIDRSFVQHAHRNRNDGLMVRSTIDLAHDLGLKVVAEGVEDEECLAFLRTLGCDLVQGYLIDRPMGADDLVKSMMARAIAA